MENVSNNQSEAVPSLLFRARKHFCALPLTHVVETMRPLPIEALAGAPAAVKGLAIIRGVPLPVIDLGSLLDGEDEPSTRFVTVRTGARQAALAVDSVAGVFYPTTDILRDVPPLLGQANASAIAAIGTLDATLLVVLNAAHLVPESVWLAIAAAGVAS